MFILKYYAGFLCLCMFFVKVLTSVGKSCNATETITNPSCNSTEQCDPATNTCTCLSDFVSENGACIKPSPPVSYSSLVENQGNGSLLAGILIPLCLIVLVICSIYISKRYELVKWLRHRLNQRNRNYDEFMIGQDDDDDPPLV